MLRNNEAHDGEIIETATDDRFVGCTFNKCEFVGCVPQSFTHCSFNECLGLTAHIVSYCSIMDTKIRFGPWTIG